MNLSKTEKRLKMNKRMQFPAQLPVKCNECNKTFDLKPDLDKGDWNKKIGDVIREKWFNLSQLREKEMKNGTKKCDEIRMREPDIKDKMATLLIQHNLLGTAWGDFHRDIEKIVSKYWKVYKRGLKWWFDHNGEMNHNI